VRLKVCIASLDFTLQCGFCLILSEEPFPTLSNNTRALKASSLNAISTSATPPRLRRAKRDTLTGRWQFSWWTHGTGIGTVIRNWTEIERHLTLKEQWEVWTLWHYFLTVVWFQIHCGYYFCHTKRRNFSASLFFYTISVHSIWQSSSNKAQKTPQKIQVYDLKYRKVNISYKKKIGGFKQHKAKKS